jgi:hypothetical protein
MRGLIVAFPRPERVVRIVRIEVFTKKPIVPSALRKVHRNLESRIRNRALIQA